jgi:GNAT superfamily N-acetyltransferase
MLTSPYKLRRARKKDIPLIRSVEREAVSLFRDMREDLGLGPQVILTPIEMVSAAQESEKLWVAVDGEDRPVGFALVFEVDGLAHFHQLNVHPSHGRKGLGRALMQVVHDWARECGYPGITLSTFRDVPWNAPFFARCGFRVMESEKLSPGLVQLVERERERGMRMDLRVIMHLGLARAE